MCMYESRLYSFSDIASFAFEMLFSFIFSISHFIGNIATLFFRLVWAVCIFFYVSFFSSNFRTPKNKIHLLFAYYFSRFSLLSTASPCFVCWNYIKCHSPQLVRKKNYYCLFSHLSASCFSQARSTTRYKWNTQNKKELPSCPHFAPSFIPQKIYIHFFSRPYQYTERVLYISLHRARVRTYVAPEHIAESSEPTLNFIRKLCIQYIIYTAWKWAENRRRHQLRCTQRQEPAWQCR